MNILKPCPFCGNKNVEAVEIFIHEGLHDGGWAWIVRCNYLHGGCGSQCGSRENAEEAVNLWNCRAEERKNTVEPVLIHKFNR